MFGPTVFGLLFSIIINFHSVSADHWIYIRSTKPRIVNNVSTKSNETDFFEELLENNITETTKNDSLFWTIPDEKEAMEIESEVSEGLENLSTSFQPLEDSTEQEITFITQGSVNSTEAAGVIKQDQIENFEPVNQSNEITPKEDNKHSEPEITPNDNVTLKDDNEDLKPEVTQNNNVTHNDVTEVPNTMEEKIILQRNNCHLEIAIQETHDLNIEIKFGKLQNNTSGKCSITLNGQENTQLGILISNIYLYQSGSQGEVLKVITADHGSEFVLKEYHSRTSYQPLLLTETRRVYLVLYYKVGNVPPKEQYSHFNLEVFSYHRYGNYIHHGSSYTELNFPYQYGAGSIPAEDTYFAPHYYYYY